MDLNKICKTLSELRDYLRIYGNDAIETEYKKLNSVLEYLESDASEEEKKKAIIQVYKILYPARGGLSDFCIWDDDYDTRIRLNAPLDSCSDKLWQYLKDYVS